MSAMFLTILNGASKVILAGVAWVLGMRAGGDDFALKTPPVGDGWAEYDHRGEEPKLPIVCPGV